MTEASRTRLFAFERKLMEKRGALGRPAAALTPGGEATLSDILKGINDIKGMIEGTAVHDDAEAKLLRAQLQDLQSHIHETKHEIASIRRPGEEDDRLTAAAMELDAIVKATEGATHNILEAAEVINDIVEGAMETCEDDATADRLADIMNATIKIFENCNFQDITGQRTSKVIKTIDYLEQRVMTMIEIWGGGEAFAGMPGDTSEEEDEDAKLLEGPQLENQGISQADIDALFD